jgi:D-alanyl-D-alanine carboxypeptidase/D-alanyl-D-alanine-endopeptidase (penicillin-binding protein 4)
LAGAKAKVAALAPSGLVFVVDEKGNELVAQNADRRFVPASVAKIVTAWLALEVLGPDYRFETRFYLDANRVLYIRGGGDPFLVSEELAELAPALVAAVGKEPLRGIVLDGSYYPSDIRMPGVENTGEAYDALNSALAVNFNTIHAVRKGTTVQSAEKQTPITPLAVSQFRARGPQGRGRVSLAQDPKVSLQYAGELIMAFVERAGGSLNGKIATGSVPAGLELQEGSGLSPGNRFTARGLAQVLQLFAPHSGLLQSGDGTRYKTGSIAGVRTLAGYADTAAHGRVRFVISLGGSGGAMRFRLLDAIKSEL